MDQGPGTSMDPEDAAHFSVRSPYVICLSVWVFSKYHLPPSSFFFPGFRPISVRDVYFTHCTHWTRFTTFSHVLALLHSHTYSLYYTHTHTRFTTLTLVLALLHSHTSTGILLCNFSWKRTSGTPVLSK